MSIKYNSWLDANNWLHVEDNPVLDQCENKIMFTSLLHSITGRPLPLPDISEVVFTNDIFRRNVHREWGSHFSHDEMTGLYCLFENNGISVKELPILKWNERWWLHPRDMAFYFYMHHRTLGLAFLWVTSICMIASCARTYKTRNGKKFRATDGKLLALLRCRTANMSLTYAICTLLIRLNKTFGSWENVARIYFKASGHPIPAIIASKRWGYTTWK